MLVSEALKKGPHLMTDNTLPKVFTPDNSPPSRQERQAFVRVDVARNWRSTVCPDQEANDILPNIPCHLALRSLSSWRLSRVEMWRGGPKGLRFHIPLIEPDVRISRIRLSDWFHQMAHESSRSMKKRDFLQGSFFTI